MGITKLLAGAVKAAAKETEIAAAAAKAVEKKLQLSPEQPELYRKLYPI